MRISRTKVCVFFRKPWLYRTGSNIETVESKCLRVHLHGEFTPFGYWNSTIRSMSECFRNGTVWIVRHIVINRSYSLYVANSRSFLKIWYSLTCPIQLCNQTRYFHWGSTSESFSEPFVGDLHCMETRARHIHFSRTVKLKTY